MITTRQITVYDLTCDYERCTTSESALPSLERAEEFLRLHNKRKHPAPEDGGME